MPRETFRKTHQPSHYAHLDKTGRISLTPNKLKLELGVDSIMNALKNHNLHADWAKMHEAAKSQSNYIDALLQELKKPGNISHNLDVRITFQAQEDIIEELKKHASEKQMKQLEHLPSYIDLTRNLDESQIRHAHIVARGDWDKLAEVLSHYNATDEPYVDMTYGGKRKSRRSRSKSRRSRSKSRKH